MRLSGGRLTQKGNQGLCLFFFFKDCVLKGLENLQVGNLLCSQQGANTDLKKWRGRVESNFGKIILATMRRMLSEW